MPGLAKRVTTTPGRYYFVGIDPGKSGGFAILYPDGKALTFKTPTKKADKGKAYDTKRMWYLLCLAHRLRSLGGAVRVFLEAQQGRPNTAKWSVQVVGEGFGRWLALIELLDFHYEVITPGVWKPAYVPKEAHKAASVMACNIMYKTSLKSTQDGEAEAVLVADYGKRRMLGW